MGCDVGVEMTELGRMLPAYPNRKGSRLRGMCGRGSAVADLLANPARLNAGWTSDGPARLDDLVRRTYLGHTFRGDEFDGGE